MSEIDNVAPVTPGGAGVPEVETRGAPRLDHPMLSIVLRRVVSGVILLLVISALSFVLVALTPGDAARAIVGTQGSQEAYEQVRQELRLDEPIYSQYWHWLSGALQGDLGRSVFTSESVASAINARIGATLSLIIGALLVSLVVGVGLGTLSAVRGGVLGRLLDGLTLVGFSIPAFWAGMVLITIFAVDLGWFPPTGYVDFSDSPSDWLSSIVLPVVALALGGVAMIAKQTREAMLDALASQHVRIAWATGISPWSIMFRHAFRNAALGVVTVVGWLFVSLLGGSVFVETVFAIPGLGSLAVSSAVRHDVPMIQGVVVYFTIIVVLVNLIVDLLYMWLDPRVRIR
jgi:peptide/nickel transport system permease protein